MKTCETKTALSSSVTLHRSKELALLSKAATVSLNEEATYRQLCSAYLYLKPIDLYLFKDNPEA